MDSKPSRLSARLRDGGGADARPQRRSESALDPVATQGLPMIGRHPADALATEAFVQRVSHQLHNPRSQD